MAKILERLAKLIDGGFSPQDAFRKEDVDYTDISGTKPPADADNTLDAIETGVSPSTGFITRTGILDLDFANGEINIDSPTFGNDGIQFDYNAGNPRAYIGDGDEKYFKFDGTDAELGYQVELLGSNSYFNDTDLYYYIGGNAGQFNYYEEVSSSSTSRVTYCPSRQRGGILLETDNASGDPWITLSIGCGDALMGTPTWNQDRRFMIKIDDLTISDLGADGAPQLWVGTGNHTIGGTQRSMGFAFLEGTTAGVQDIYAWWANGTTSTSQSLKTDYTVSDTKFELFFDVSEGDILFYIDDVLEYTATTNVPTGTTDADVAVILMADNVQTSSGPFIDAYIGEFRFLHYY